ncbi:bifunctional diguanylate cyclase/phosphodiesterase [Sulfuriferula nivalis]|uniref:Diguanylate cyclase/phosphodiesterase n=1 Tax=Sulfuriferula nivalis TaxID=2675298 RepID=A0A809SB07_9PROT|nr:EAL domain-containing protein [Sulfuriferula nivalis]BBP01982.1 hypothetical protein SFSGTM_26900 [Sulfuriferula nivalis]
MGYTSSEELNLNQRKLALWLFGASSLFVLMIISFAAYQIWHRHETLYDESQKSLILLNVAMAEYTERTLSNFDLVLRDLRSDISQLDLQSPKDKVVADQTLQKVVSQVRGFTSFNVLNKNGDVLATSLQVDRDVVNYSDRDYFHHQQENIHPDKLLVETAILGRRSKQWVIPMTLRMEDRAGNFRGMLYAGINMEQLLSYYQSVMPFTHGAAALFRQDGRLLARYPFVEGALSKDYSHIELFHEHLPLSKQGIYRTVSAIDGVPRLLSYYSIPKYSLVVVVSLDERQLLAKWHADTWVIALMAAVAIMFALGLAQLLYRQLRISALQSDAIKQSEELYKSLVDHAPIAVFLHWDGSIVFANFATTELLQAKQPEELVGLAVTEIIVPADRPLALSRIGAMLEGRAIEPAALRFLTSTGSEVNVEAVSVLVSYGGNRAILTIARDVTERKEFEERLIWQAQHDAETKLPNRFLFFDRLAQAIETAKRSQRPLALLFIDLDQFKRINDTLGHLVGDELLGRAAERFLQVVHTSDTVARLGGDEFAIILSEIVTQADAEQFAAKLLDAFRQPIELNGRSITVTTSIGIALFPRDGETTTVLMASADAAMYNAKEAGRNTVRVFNQLLGERMRERLEIENALRHALSNNELRLVFQPILGAGNKVTVSAEALLRWTHPVLGNISPDIIIPIAEETGLIIPIGIWILRQACSELCRWEQETGQVLKIAVNVSARQFEDAAFPEMVAQILHESGLAADRLELEITERLLIESTSDAAINIQKLHDQGIHFSLDDFGTGYSSLSLLSHAPVAILKIDKSFVDRLGNNHVDDAMVNSIIAIAQILGLCTIAEGVESQYQLERLQEMGVDFIQGYYFSRALSSDDFVKWLKQLS